MGACEGRCVTRWGARVPDGLAELTSHPRALSGPGPGAPTLGAGGLMRNAGVCGEPGAGRGTLLVRHFLQFTFNEVGERGVCIGVPKMLTVTPYRGKRICSK